MVDWITLSQTAGTGNATVSVTASSYSELLERATSLMVSTATRGAYVTINQSLAEDFYLVPNSLSYNSSGGTRVISVSSTNPWTASTSASWLTISPLSGTGSTNVSIVSQSAVSSTERSAVITFTNSLGYERKVSVIQEELSEIFIDRDGINVSYYGGGYAYLTSFSSAWTSEYPEWLSIYPDEGGSGTTQIHGMLNSETYPTSGVAYFKNANGVVKASLIVRTDEYYANFPSPVYADWNASAVTFRLETNYAAYLNANVNGITGYTTGPYFGTHDITATFTASTNDSYSSQIFRIGLDENMGSITVVRRGKPVPTPDNYTIYYVGDFGFGTGYSSAFDNTIVSCREVDGLHILEFENEVKTVGYRAFYNQYTSSPYNMKAVFLPNCVETIGEQAFLNAYLINIVIPDSVKVIGNNAFDLSSTWENSVRSNIVLPSSASALETIGESAFRRQKFVYTTIDFPASVMEIGPCAFQKTNVEKAVFHEYTWNIRGAAFYGSNLKEIWMYAPYCPMLGYASTGGIGGNTFQNISANGVLHIPAEGVGYENIKLGGNNPSYGGLPSAWTVSNDLVTAQFQDCFFHPSTREYPASGVTSSKFWYFNKNTNGDHFDRPDWIDTSWWGNSYHYSYGYLSLSANTSSARVGTITLQDSNNTGLASLVVSQGGAS